MALCTMLAVTLLRGDDVVVHSTAVARLQSNRTVSGQHQRKSFMDCCVVLTDLHWCTDNPEEGRGRTKPISQAEAVEELVQTVRSDG